MIYEITTTDYVQTQKLAAKLALELRGGEVIELVSDLGGGKTTFVQGLVRSLGYEGDITSPTFTLSNIYRLEDGLEIHHYDLYRLSEGGIVGEELAEDMRDTGTVTLIEWANAVEQLLPADRLVIELAATGEGEREIKIQSSGEVSDRLIKGLTE